MGERLARRPPHGLVAARARASGSARDGRHPRARPPAGLRAWTLVLGPGRLTPPGSRSLAQLAAHPLHGAPPGAWEIAAHGAARRGRKGGGDEGTRTPDPRDANAVLSQLSYIPTRTTRARGRIGARV